ncbi:hypothetical protein HPP92_021648 [Vanilla planifolia]|uniref:peptidyl-tRNA hydrolase n=2 Tax=Vanilla planifolia TaxID=51239 RepID=A0A835Q5A8_VANPL|nr:hypothetical protein HPP92_021648 [Vanilla planifolia]
MSRVSSLPIIHNLHALQQPRIFSSFSSSRVRVPAFPYHRGMSTSGVPTAMTTTPPTSSNAGDGTAEPSDVLVQYVVLRRDLINTWPLGSIVTQGCHAAVFAIWSHVDRADTTAYLAASNIHSMYKVTLEVKGEAQIKNLAEKLKADGIEHKLWIEQPENIPTCLATRPYPKSLVSSYFKKLKLCK